MAMHGNTIVRPLEPGDLEAVVRIDQQQTGRARTEYFAPRLRALDEDGRWTLGVAAERKGRTVGFAIAHLVDGEFGGAAPVGVLDAIGVPTALHREGTASALLVALESTLAVRGVRRLRSQAAWTDLGITSFFAATGFSLAPRVVLERPLDRPVDSDPVQEEVPVRSMTEADLPGMIRVDRQITGRDRTAYLLRKAAQVARESAVRVSLVADGPDGLAGFLMARVDFGEFGRAEPTAILDTIGVAPALAGRRIGRALVEQLLRNVAGLRAERLVTEVGWNHLPLLGFLEKVGFGHAQRLSFEKAFA